MSDYRRHRQNQSRGQSSSGQSDAQGYSRYSREASPSRSRRESSRSQGASADADYSRYSRKSMGAAANYTDYETTVAPVDPRYSRSNAAARHQKKSKSDRRKKIALSVVAAVVAVMVIGAGAAFAYFQSISKNLHQGVTDDTLSALGGEANIKYSGEAFYMLMLGTDGAWWRDQDPDFDGTYRTDSMLLVRVDPKNLKVSMISLQRDTIVNIPGYGEQKLNAAYTIGGAAKTIEVVESICKDTSTGTQYVDIDHYAEINFDGFCLVIDAIGGVEVDVPMEIDDPEAGGHVDAGLQTLDGDKALILCRSRHAYDQIGKGDELRAANQRMVLSAVAKKILKSDLPTMIAAIQAISENVATDFSVTDILSIANTLREMDPDDDIYTAQMPTDTTIINEVYYEILNKPQWFTMLERTNDGLPPVSESVIDEATGVTISSSGGGKGASGTGNSSEVELTGKVMVWNGSGISGVAGKAAKTLTDKGFTTATDNAPTQDYTDTYVVYADASNEEVAKKLSSALGTGRVIPEKDSKTSVPEGYDYLVILGSSYKTK